MKADSEEAKSDEPKQAPETKPEPNEKSDEAHEQPPQQPLSQQPANQAPELTPEEKEQVQIINQLLRKVPDDPAILLRNKMKLESQKRYRQRIQQQGVEKSW